jgi:DtxR family Mn-dependent transcriptional regulator
MPSETVENYLKQVCLQRQRLGPRALVPMGVLAEAVGVTPGTATTMVKSLADAKLLKYEPRAGVRLTAAGRRLAYRVLRRHRLIEQLLVEVLGMDWSEVHVEAEQLEHAVSDKVLARIDALLGHPETDPHGSPIPQEGQPLASDDAVGLDHVAAGETARVVRIVDHDADFLRFIEQHGLVPGAEVRVVSCSPHADAWTVRAGRREPITIGPTAAKRVRVAGHQTT